MEYWPSKYHGKRGTSFGLNIAEQT